MARYCYALLILVCPAIFPYSALAHQDAAHSHGQGEVHSHEDVPFASLSEAKRLEAVYNRIAALQDQLDAQQHRVWLRDVLGGIGYIVGITGVAFYFLGARRKQPKSDAP